jgi:hypothetical protein
MAIQLTQQPTTANAALSVENVKEILAALSSVVTLPAGETFENAIAINLTVQPAGTGVFNVRFK